MAFVKRFGGWRPVELEEGVGRLRGGGGELLEGVDYRFEVWHQMVGGFHGPFRSEGRLGGVSAEDLEPFVGRDVVLELEDDRRLELRLDADGRLVAHQRPDRPKPANGA